jgi:hypothetical protein
MNRRRPGGAGECWRRQPQLAGIIQSSCEKYYAIVCSEMILGCGLHEMASLSNSAITKRDVTNGLVFVLYREPMLIGNLFIYTFWTQIFILDVSRFFLKNSVEKK